MEEQQFLKNINENKGIIIKIVNLYADDAEDRKDLHQEIIFQAWKATSGFKGEAKFSTWLYRIATNLCIDQLRRYRRKVSINDVDAYVELTEPSYMEDEEKLELQITISELQPPKYGEIIKAYFWEGKSYQELAEQYSTSTNTIGTWMRRAKAQLKEKIS